MTKYSNLEREEDERTDLEKRMYKLSKDTIPSSIDRTEDGEFVVDDTVYPKVSIINGRLQLDDPNADLGYFLNEDCNLHFYDDDGDIKAYYYSDADKDYYFSIDVNEKMSDKEIKTQLVKGFSEKFGWVEKFEINGIDTNGIKAKFWAVILYEGGRKLVEVDRELFQANLDVWDENGEWIEEKYNELELMACRMSNKYFPKVNEENVIAEFMRLNEEDEMECVFLKISLIDVGGI